MNVMTLLARAIEHHQAGRFVAARKLYEQILDQHPTHPHALHYSGLLAYQTGEYALAVELIEKAIRIAPEFSDFYNHLGLARQALGQNEQAKRAFRTAIQMETGFFEAHNNLGIALQAGGRLADAQSAYRRALELQPTYTEAWLNLASCKHFESDTDTDLVAVKGLVDRSELPEVDRMRALFALGKIYDDLGRYDEAFHHYQEANRILDRTNDFDPAPFVEEIDRVIRTFDTDYFQRLDAHGDDSASPVFIVGMPRSGTTLVEQIFASHPLAYGAGESPALPKLIAKLPRLLDSRRPYPECMTDLSNGQKLQRAASVYLDALRAEAPQGVNSISDKLPFNFRHLGLIATLFPKARVIHVSRDALDCCLSIFFQPFTRGHPYSSDLEHIGAVYAAYQRTMSHWRRVLPIPVLELSYEELVEDVETQTRSLIEFVGLPWNPACLEFYKTRRSVQTASAWQVRQPIHKSSRARWKKYEDQLEPLRTRLAK